MNDQLKSDRMLDALERLEVIKDELKHDRADIGQHLHCAIEALKDALAQQLLTERRRQSRSHSSVGDMGHSENTVIRSAVHERVGPTTASGFIEPLVISGYNDGPPSLAGGVNLGLKTHYVCGCPEQCAVPGPHCMAPADNS